MCCFHDTRFGVVCSSSPGRPVSRLPLPPPQASSRPGSCCNRSLSCTNSQPLPLCWIIPTHGQTFLFPNFRKHPLTAGAPGYYPNSLVFPHSKILPALSTSPCPFILRASLAPAPSGHQSHRRYHTSKWEEHYTLYVTGLPGSFETNKTGHVLISHSPRCLHAYILFGALCPALRSKLLGLQMAPLALSLSSCTALVDTLSVC